MTIAVCDDNKIDRIIICDLLNTYAKETSLHIDLIEYDSGEGLLYDVEEGRGFDVVVLDIFMNGLLGIDVAIKLREYGYRGNIIFLTTSPEFAIASYDVEALGYLLKPVCYERLYKLMKRIDNAAERTFYRIKKHSSILRIPYNDILYIESENSKCTIHCVNEDGKYVVYKKLSDIEAELNDRRFLRCHKSYLINMDYVKTMSCGFELISGESIQIRQRGATQIRQHYESYIEEKIEITKKKQASWK